MAAAVARPQLRNLLSSSLKRTMMVATGVSFICTVAWRVGICDARKNKYTEFHKNFDGQKEFERMKAAGVFTSVNKDGSLGQGW